MLQEPLTDAQAKIVEENISLADQFACRNVKTVANRLYGQRYKEDLLDDLKEIAYDALMLAAQKFDPTRGVPFPAYAVITMRFALKRFIHDRANSREVAVDPSNLSELCENDDSWSVDEEDVSDSLVTESLVELLPPSHRAILTEMLRGKNQTEIARELGLPVSTVMGRIRRMRSQAGVKYYSVSSDDSCKEIALPPIVKTRELIAELLALIPRQFEKHKAVQRAKAFLSSAYDPVYVRRCGHARRASAAEQLVFLDVHLLEEECKLR